jgi:hypothetical protein
MATFLDRVRWTCWWVIGLPGGSSPRPPFSRFARRAVVGRRPSLLCSWFIWCFWTRPKTCRWVIGLPGGSSPRPPFSRFARRAVVGRRPSLLCSWLIWCFWTRPKTCRWVSGLPGGSLRRLAWLGGLEPSCGTALPATAR